MFSILKTTLIAASWVAASLPATATMQMDGVALEESVQVAGNDLKLNGAGISMRLIFKVYVIGLYLPNREHSAQEVLHAEGPRRLRITMLRDVSGSDFYDKLRQYTVEEGASIPALILDNMQRVIQAIDRQSNGLHKGDTLTLDWVPGTGTLVGLNNKPLTAPMRDIAFYKALLNIWLGDKPTDSDLKMKLLGRPTEVRRDCLAEAPIKCQRNMSSL
ncbi:chalcone isomerase family protein [Rhodoferax sp.]|uniref:chalcone isomerase family protein n=1 Tax=Rhodoferax sp. TaxID=50421 RepID=UPI00283C4242|nr:chalcone isomerase family protein [Rhodoferax sp.]MDR3370107.1 chalcone isomerase family protein [Rhodoferax sp.]